MPYLLASDLPSQPGGVRFRAALSRPGIYQLPGAHNGHAAIQARNAGFDGLYLSGAAMTASMGLPDLGIITVDEVAFFIRQIVRASGLPLLVDGDTGYGEALNVMHMVRTFEEAGERRLQFRPPRRLRERGLWRAVRDFLLYRGMNDVYLVQGAREWYALRVWRKTYRDVDEVRYELDFLEFLKSREFPASTALRTREGELYFKVMSPEGPRALALYTWAPGRKFGDCLSEETAERIGAAFAKMHLLGQEYQGDKPYSTENALRFKVTVPALLDFVYDRPDDLRDYAIIAERLPQFETELVTQVTGFSVPGSLAPRAAATSTSERIVCIPKYSTGLPVSSLCERRPFCFVKVSHSAPPSTALNQTWAMRSPSTISRLCASIGFQSASTVHEALRSTLWSSNCMRAFISRPLSQTVMEKRSRPHSNGSAPSWSRRWTTRPERMRGRS